MIIEISDDLISKAHLTENELKKDFAIFLYSKGFLTLGQAGNFAGLDIYEFQKFLGENKTPTNYSIPDFNDDIKTIQKFL